MDMEGHAKKCVERCCELANETTQQLYKVATPCMDDHQFKEEENESDRRTVHSMLTNCSQMSVSGSNWTQPDLWSVKNLPVQTKWKIL